MDTLYKSAIKTSSEQGKSRHIPTQPHTHTSTSAIRIISYYSLFSESIKPCRRCKMIMGGSVDWGRSYKDLKGRSRL